MFSIIYSIQKCWKKVSSPISFLFPEKNPILTMNKHFIILFPLLIAVANGEDHPFDIEIRPRIIDGAKVIVNVDVENGIKKPIDYLEGFISEFDGDGKLKNEKRLVILYEYEPPLQPGFSATKSLIYSLEKEKPHTYEFRVSKVKFMSDARIFTWHKDAGFIRID